MKIILLGDLHITDKKPINRKESDDFFKIYERKLAFVLSHAIENQIHLILQAGDFFHIHNESLEVIQRTIELLSDYCLDPSDIFNKVIKIHAIYGQHDLKYHRFRDYTALKMLSIADIVNTESSAAWNFPYKDRVVFHKFDFGIEMGKAVNCIGNNIAVCHKMIVKDGPLFPGQKDFTLAKDLLTQFNYDLILSGDNHSTFVKEVDNKILINPGCLVRRNIDQIDHKPCFFVYDTDAHKYEQIFIPCLENPFKENIVISKEKILDNQFMSFVECLKKDGKIKSVDFKTNLEHAANESGESIKNIILEHIDGPKGTD